MSAINRRPRDIGIENIDNTTDAGKPVSSAAATALAGKLAAPAGITITSGTGTPLSVVVANIGSLFLRTDGGAATSLYVKESGNGASTGWVAK